VARLARAVAIDVVHHVTQRGNRRQVILTPDSEPLNSPPSEKKVNVRLSPILEERERTAISQVSTISRGHSEWDALFCFRKYHLLRRFSK